MIPGDHPASIQAMVVLRSAGAVDNAEDNEAGAEVRFVGAASLAAALQCATAGAVETNGDCRECTGKDDDDPGMGAE
jgi:hypothetical protein